MEIPTSWGVSIMLVAIVAIFFFARRQSSQLIGAFSALAGRYGLRFDPPSSPSKMARGKQTLEAQGQIEGRDFRIWTYLVESTFYATGEGSLSVQDRYEHFLRFSIPLRGPGQSLYVARENIFSRIGQSVGLSSDMELGEAAFDGKFVIRSSDADFARRVLNGELRQALLDNQNALGFKGHFGTENGELYYDEMIVSGKGYLSDHERLPRLIGIALLMARRMEENNQLA